MEAKQFFEEVAKMRQLQKDYFKTRSSMALYASKKQEKLIDDEIARAQGVLERNKQMNLGL